MAANTAARVQKYRLSLRGSGLRPIQIWVPDTNAPGFLEECRRQSQLVALADRSDNELNSLLDTALSDLDAL